MTADDLPGMYERALVWHSGRGMLYDGAYSSDGYLPVYIVRCYHSMIEHIV